MSCDAELCPYWTGQGCICAVMDIDRDGDQYPATFPTDDAEVAT